MIIALVPAYNESERIAGVVRGLLGVVNTVLVINDGSTDDTESVAQNAGAIVITHPFNLGQGAALETGHEFARAQNADWVVHFDGDGQFEPADISRALNFAIEKKVDVVFGSRFIGQNNKSIPWFKRRIILPVARPINQWFSGLKLRDVHNGFRVFNNHALGKIHLTQNRMAHATEFSQQVKAHHLSFAEFPVTVTYNEFGQGMGAGFQIIRDLIFGQLTKN